jgi:farnesyl-diphosphate farnesyltransferase
MDRSKVIDEQVLNVSRSFAFVIDRLPEPLRREVQVAYLLFRLGDNIEDTSSLETDEKQRLLDRLLHCFRTGGSFATELAHHDVSGWQALTEGERGLFGHADRVIDEFAGLGDDAREMLLDEAENMFRGMARFQSRRAVDGYMILQDENDLDEYCYYVAGTVGDYLTHRFLARMDGISEARRKRILDNRRHLALVLQTTNILRDVRDDHAHGHIFYPRSLFDCFDARRLVAPEMKEQVLTAGVRMVRWLMPAIRGAGDYILALPAGERRIRSFCIIPYVMALKTILLCLGNEAILSHQSVKMNRRGVMRTQYFSRLFAPLQSPLRWWLSNFWVRLESRLDVLGG